MARRFGGQGRALSLGPVFQTPGRRSPCPVQTLESDKDDCERSCDSGPSGDEDSVLSSLPSTRASEQNASRRSSSMTSPGLADGRRAAARRKIQQLTRRLSFEDSVARAARHDAGLCLSKDEGHGLDFHDASVQDIVALRRRSSIGEAAGPGPWVVAYEGGSGRRTSARGLTNRSALAYSAKTGSNNFELRRTARERLRRRCQIQGVTLASLTPPPEESCIATLTQEATPSCSNRMLPSLVRPTERKLLFL